jgi:hypothetical protein
MDQKRKTQKAANLFGASSVFALACMLTTHHLAVAEWNTPTAITSDVSFRTDVLPILSERCFACHGFDAESREGGIRLDTFDGATGTGDSGATTILPGKADESELIRRLKSTDDGEVMPPSHLGKPLTADQVNVIERWINQGAKYEGHWAFEPPRSTAPPMLKNVDHPIDRFIQARLQEQGISPSPIASAETLLRRTHLDMLGLPPSIDELETFKKQYEQNPSEAYDHLIQNLLNSPHYGERWARWWLDQARYADSNGYSIDSPREIWAYRDWVVDAFNRDIPFDQFAVEQLAGDLLPNATQSQRIATGFHRNTQINEEGGIDPEQFRIDSVFDRVATTGSVLLGLTVGCCQCHDHKFDPISQKEYYQLFAFFNNQDEPSLRVYREGTNVTELKDQLTKAESEIDQYVAVRRENLDAWEQGLTAEEKKKLPNPIQAILKKEKEKRNKADLRELFHYSIGKLDEDFQAQFQTYQKLNGEFRGETTTLVLQERKEPRKTHLFIKGDFTRPADEVGCSTPSVLHSFVSSSDRPNRLDLAKWIVDRNNPLTARVIVNRVWQQYFGRGLVETESDFGILGSPPSHPQLLDWLALEFQKDWSLKRLHRLILQSHTYKQSSDFRSDLVDLDPSNYLLGRQQRLRLDAEIVRDVALSASGLLVRKLGGAPVFPPIPDGVMNLGQVKRAWKVSSGDDRYRRALYTFIYRATPPPSLSVFDAPEGISTCTRRARSNTPLQALTLLNDSGFNEFATSLAAIIERDGIETAFKRCVSRPPTVDELTVLNALDAQSAARVLLNLDETMTRE